MSKPTLIALLRGINVGGRHKLPMKELVSIFEDIGCTDTRTYIQSGNVVFEPGSQAVETLPTRIAERIEATFGFSVPIVLRTKEQLDQVIRNNPFLAQGADLKTLGVAFLNSAPDPEQITKLDPDRSPPDAFVVQGREIYLHFPNGMARTKLTNPYFDSKLKTISTVRNWRTTLKLQELAT